MNNEICAKGKALKEELRAISDRLTAMADEAERLGTHDAHDCRRGIMMARTGMFEAWKAARRMEGAA